MEKRTKEGRLAVAKGCAVSVRRACFSRCPHRVGLHIPCRLPVLLEVDESELASCPLPRPGFSRVAGVGAAILQNLTPPGQAAPPPAAGGGPCCLPRSGAGAYLLCCLSSLGRLLLLRAAAIAAYIACHSC